MEDTSLAPNTGEGTPAPEPLGEAVTRAPEPDPQATAPDFPEEGPATEPGQPREPVDGTPLEAEPTEQESTQATEAVTQLTARWSREATELAALYPGFDLRMECRHPVSGQRFCSLLKTGLDLRTAFEAVHREELMRGAMQYAAQRAKELAFAAIRTGGLRPVENGGASQSPAYGAELDVNRLSRAQRGEIARRVLRGERIVLHH